MIGWLYSKAILMLKNDERAVEWWMKAAGMVTDAAQCELGIMYAAGGRKKMKGRQWNGIKRLLNKDLLQLRIILEPCMQMV